ncbi:MAG: ATP-binding cassette domain-containing protein, partial [Gammaproteobacteria bacterium]
MSNVVATPEVPAPEVPELSVPALSVYRLERRFAGRQAVRAVSFSIQPGEVVGLLGLNGAGKSTVLAMIAGALAPSRGQVNVAGADLMNEPRIARRRLGYLPDRPPLYDDLTVREYLYFAASVRGLTRAQSTRACVETIASAGLAPVAGRRVGNLSKGYRQRVG